jgi:hypothetical protein
LLVAGLLLVAGCCFSFEEDSDVEINISVALIGYCLLLIAYCPLPVPGIQMIM